MRYLHTMVRVTDIDASLRFWCDGLGLSEVSRREYPDGKFTLIFLAAEEDSEQFAERTGALVAQYNKYEPLPGTNVNGTFTLGENIGDLSGLSIAYKAYKMSLGGREAPVIDGLTGDQRFFIGWAQAFRSKIRDEALVTQIQTDPHSPDRYRVNGIVYNVDAFYDAFDITADHQLYIAPENRVKIW